MSSRVFGFPSRPGEVTLITYADGKPTGLQTVTAELTGEVTVGTYRPLPA